MSPLGLPYGLGLLYAGLFGAIVGSYLNVVVYRLPRGLSTWKPRSRCPGCRRNIAWFDNVPILSYLALGGRCRHCQARISIRYPLIELMTALLFVTAFARFGWTPTTLIAFVFLALLSSLALIDAKHLLLPDVITLPGLLVGLAASPVSSLTDPVSASLGALFGALILLAMIAVYLLVRGELGMGLGDPKMLALIGAFLGLPKTILTLLVASLAGTLFSVFLIIARKANQQTRLPFGVYLAIGAVTALFLGDHLTRWYFAGWL